MALPILRSSIDSYGIHSSLNRPSHSSGSRTCRSEMLWTNQEKLTKNRTILIPLLSTMRSALPGIKSIGYLPCKNLPPFILQKYLVGIPVGIYAVATPVEFFTNASCEADQDPDNGSVLEKTTLHFSTTATISSNEPLAFVVKDINDRAYVIGFREAPYPIMTVNEAIDAEKNFRLVKITFTSRKSLIPCAI